MPWTEHHANTRNPAAAQLIVKCREMQATELSLLALILRKQNECRSSRL